MTIIEALKAERLEIEGKISRWEQTATVDIAIGERNTTAMSIYTGAQRRLRKVNAALTKLGAK